MQFHVPEQAGERDVLLGVIVQARVPPYFDQIIDAFNAGAGGRFVRLGYWDAGKPSAVRGPAADEEFSGAQKRLDDVVLAAASLGDGQRILDVGCGFGGTLENVNRARVGMTLVGLNIDARQLDICRRLEPAASNRYYWTAADACSMPFPDRSFDRILCIEAMFHFLSRRTFFQEVSRILRPGGAFICSDIVVTESAKSLPIPGFCIEAAIRDGFGPWPDFWGDDADHIHLALSAGMSCTELRDATANTVPSHEYTTPRNADELHDSGNAALRGALMLRWLHRSGHLKYLCFRFDKVAE